MAQARAAAHCALRADWGCGRPLGGHRCWAGQRFAEVQIQHAAGSPSRPRVAPDARSGGCRRAVRTGAPIRNGEEGGDSDSAQFPPHPRWLRVSCPVFWLRVHLFFGQWQGDFRPSGARGLLAWLGSTLRYACSRRCELFGRCDDRLWECEVLRTPQGIDGICRLASASLRYYDDRQLPFAPGVRRLLDRALRRRLAGAPEQQRHGLAVVHGEGPSSPKLVPRSAQRALLTPQANPGTLYRCGGAGKSSLFAAAGGKRAEIRPKRCTLSQVCCAEH